MSYYSEDDMDDMDMDGSFNRFQMGYQVGVNLGYKSLNFGIGYKASFLPIYSEDEVKIQTGGIVATIGYNF